MNFTVWQCVKNPKYHNKLLSKCWNVAAIFQWSALNLLRKVSDCSFKDSTLKHVSKTIIWRERLSVWNFEFFIHVAPDWSTPGSGVGGVVDVMHRLLARSEFQRSMICSRNKKLTSKKILSYCHLHKSTFLCKWQFSDKDPCLVINKTTSV